MEGRRLRITPVVAVGSQWSVWRLHRYEDGRVEIVLYKHLSVIDD